MKVNIFLAGLAIASGSQGLASGMAVHMFIADEALEQLSSQELQSMLERHRDAYRMGAVYPDTGYAINHSYGELSHWSDFLNQYQKVLMEACPDPLKSEDCQAAWSHFFGSLSHTVGDINFDKYFVTETARQDFDGDIGKAQEHTDPGCDFLAILDYKRAFDYPRIDQPNDILIETYRRLGLEVSESEINRGAKTLKLGMVAEPIGAPFTYLYYKFKMPWGSQNYFDARGGVQDTADRLAIVWDYVWQGLQQAEMSNFSNQGGWPGVSFYIDDFSLDDALSL
ncbi:zinc dependent phospholipase C family protein [Pseudobacteriovorax antillogorgiicola]|uniref:Zinc dependent phospholipase C n=1 Tax=Pseudobacteriovorax antillogorgiicola TaxID=1513793 RepID=A0A1Y6BAA0_9BACT|nr:zinc dependent phospholipase C family protein [Pseudobacteriovorax antillogorgiicola]TCS57425.1 zinc dependent phospholipase C [Pseudobacteriovorax antillogorgiicola]SMF01249.1 Zinc dependent phospholipase C [Pseudobacteriovorax antillogorgiicola]